MSETTLPHLRAGTGVPLVVIPGISGRRGIPTRLARWMGNKGIAELSEVRAVVSIDRRVGLESDISIEKLASEYAEAIRGMFDAPVDIVGVSTGGSIALQLAADFPQLVRRLVLVSTAHRLSDNGRHIQTRVAALLRQHRPRRAAALFLSNTGATAPARALLAVFALLTPRVVVGHHDSDLIFTLEAETSFDIAPRLGSIQAHTLVTGGALDRFYTLPLFDQMNARLPNSSIEVFPHGGHIGTFGNRRLAQLILEFLARSQR